VDKEEIFMGNEAATGRGNGGGPHTSLPGMSVVICTMNRPRELRTAIASILQQDIMPLEVIVVDASGGAESGHVVKSLGESEMIGNGKRPRIRYIAEPSWLTRQRNVGARAARGDVIQFIDDDIVLRPGYIRELLGVYATRPEVGGAMGIIEENASRKPGGTLLERFFLQNRVFDGNMQPSGLPTWLADAAEVTEVDHLNGCMSFRREVLREFKSDEKIDGYGVMEDIDLSWRVGRKWTLVVVPQARMSHRPAPGGRISLEELLSTKVYNHYYLFRKNFAGGGCSHAGFWWGQFGFLVTTLKFYRSFEAARGLIRGYRMILRHMNTGSESEGSRG